jgi:hypothetical protein
VRQAQRQKGMPFPPACPNLSKFDYIAAGYSPNPPSSNRNGNTGIPSLRTDSNLSGSTPSESRIVAATYELSGLNCDGMITARRSGAYRRRSS